MTLILPKLTVTTHSSPRWSTDKVDLAGNITDPRNFEAAGIEPGELLTRIVCYDCNDMLC